MPPRSAPAPSPRRALLAGATGLVGRSLLTLLLASPRYSRVELLLRRRVHDLPLARQLATHQVDFARLGSLPSADDGYIALGTTIKVAGSEQAFRQVDFDHVVNLARATRDGGARRVLVVSALGADAHSRVFYNRVKGEMQEAVAQLGFELTVFAQPSLLLGDRTQLGQPTRPGEVWAERLLRPVLPLVPRSVRPIAARDVARALVQAAFDTEPGVRWLKSADMQP